MSSQQLKATIRVNKKFVTFRFSPNSRMLAIGETSGGIFDDETIRLYDASNGQFTETLQRPVSLGRHVAFSSDSAELAALDGNNKIVLWSIMTGKQIPVTPQSDLADFPPDILYPISTLGAALTLHNHAMAES